MAALAGRIASRGDALTFGRAIFGFASAAAAGTAAAVGAAGFAGAVAYAASRTVGELSGDVGGQIATAAGGVGAAATVGAIAVAVTGENAARLTAIFEDGAVAAPGFGGPASGAVEALDAHAVVARSRGASSTGTAAAVATADFADAVGNARANRSGTCDGHRAGGVFADAKARIEETGVVPVGLVVIAEIPIADA